MPVLLVIDVKDISAETLAFEFKEQLRSSSGLRLVQSAAEAAYHVRVAALDIADADAVAYSVAITMQLDGKLPGFITHFVGACSTSLLQRCARSILASTDETISETTRSLMERAKQLPSKK